jgi:hypothetical protein
LKETRPLWPPQRGVGLREPNLGKTNLCVSLHYSLAICFAPSLADSFLFLTLIRLVVVFIFVNFSFALFTPPLGDYHKRTRPRRGTNTKAAGFHLSRLPPSGFFPPSRSVSRRPIWAGARGDNLLVGPGTPGFRNADNYVWLKWTSCMWVKLQTVAFSCSCNYY